MFRFSNLIIFELTRDCNIKCKYCYAIEKDKYKGEVIDFELFKKIIRRIAEQRVLNNKREEELSFVFHGGEFTLVGKENFKRYCEYIINTFNGFGLNFYLGAQSNGTLLDEEWLDIFEYYNVSLGISFDSFCEEGSLRFSNTTKNKLIENIKSASERNINVNILSVLTRNNYKSIDKDDEVLHSLSHNNISRKVNFVEDVNCNSEYEISGKKIFNNFELKELKRFLKTGDLGERHTTGLLNDTILDLLTIRNTSFKTGCAGRLCGAGITMLAVRPDGTMGYCDRYSKDFSENFIEHCLDYDFLGVHQLKKVFEFNKIKSHELRVSGCDTCRAQNICEGSCFAFHFSKYGFYGIDKELICPQYLGYYDFCKDNFIKIVKRMSEVNFMIQPCELKIMGFNNYYVDILYKNGISIYWDKEHYKFGFKAK